MKLSNDMHDSVNENIIGAPKMQNIYFCTMPFSFFCIAHVKLYLFSSLQQFSYHFIASFFIAPSQSIVLRDNSDSFRTFTQLWAIAKKFFFTFCYGFKNVKERRVITICGAIQNISNLQMYKLIQLMKQRDEERQLLLS